jgi:hypothetical protein
VPKSRLERVTRRSRSLRRALVLGMIADCEVPRLSCFQKVPSNTEELADKHFV